MAQIIDLGKIRFNWAGTYSSGTEYSYNDLVKYGPNLYAYTSNLATTGNVPTNTVYWTLSTEGITYRGTYNTSSTLYYRNDIVTDGTNTYIVVTQHTSDGTAANASANLEIIAVGQQGIPNQTGQINKVLTTDGTDPSWTATTYLTKNYVGNAQGQGAYNFETSAALSDTMSVFSLASPDFAQFAIANTSTGTNASTDFIAYSANGTNDSGWIDMGITSVDFDAATFGITGPNDGYIFMSSPRTDTKDVTSILVAGGVATVTTGSNHGFTLGDQVRMFNCGNFDGIHTISAVSALNKYSFSTTEPTQSDTAVLPFGEAFIPLGNGNLVLATDKTGLENNIVFAAGGFYDGSAQMQIINGDKVEVLLNGDSTSSTTGSLITAGGAGIAKDLSVGANIRVVDTTYQGTGAEAFETSAGLTNAKSVTKLSGGPYAQVAIVNSTDTASSDLIVYADDGDDASGWIDLGIANSNFDDTTYGITAPGDGYIFVNAKAGETYKGNLVFATGANGTENRIVFAAGGYDSGNTQMTIYPDEKVLINIPTPSVSPTTGALVVTGGVGIVGDVNIQGAITFGGSGTTVETSNLTVTDPIIYFGDGNPADVIDMGIVGEYTSSGVKYSGLLRDASDDVWKFFEGASTAPVSNVLNFSQAGLTYSTIQVNQVQIVAAPTISTHAANKTYVDGIQSDLETMIFMGAYY